MSREPGDDPPRDRPSTAAQRTAAGPGEGAPRRAERDPAEADRRRQLEADLRRQVEAATALGGEVEAAVMGAGWRRPVVVASEPGGAARRIRMWSISKVLTMVALLREMGWDGRPGRPLPPEVEEALRGAIVGSENCRQRRIVVELQRLAGGAEAARAALGEALRRGGAAARIATESEPPEPICLPFLETQVETPEPLAPALLLGTSTWRIGDAVRLMRAIGAGRFGAAVSDRVLALMREPKRVSREVPAGELTAPADWGAGRALAGLDPAYKAGWGGALSGDFLAAQIAFVELPGDERLAIAVAFHPDPQPSGDDPGRTAAPQGVELVMRALLPAASG